MRFNYKLSRLATVLTMGLLLAGCGGINASKSVSPASFFLPGLMKVEPKESRPDTTVPAPPPVTQVAFAQ
jgi:hypothetical protein